MSWNERFFHTFWPYVGAAITAHHTDTQREVRCVLRLLQLQPGARILDVPCGFGRHAVELASRGFQVTGLDISRELLSKAREAAAARGVHLDFRQGDMRHLRYRQRFDALLNIFTSFGYFGDEEDLEVLKRFRRALMPGGQLVLHLVTLERLLRNFQPASRVRMGEFVVWEKRTFELTKSVMTTEWTARRGRSTWRGTTRLRVYSCHELMRLLKQAGFSRVQCFGDLCGSKPELNSRWLVLLARR